MWWLSLKFICKQASLCPSNLTFLRVTFAFLEHFRVLLLILMTFWSILVSFGGFGKIKKSKMADPKWPPFGEHWAIKLPFLAV